MRIEGGAGNEGWQHDSFNGVRTYRQLCCVFAGQDDFEETISNWFSVAAVSNCAGGIQNDVLNFLDELQCIGLALEGDCYFESDFVAGLDTACSTQFSFGNARLVEHGPLVSRLRVLLEPLEVDHSLNWIGFLEVHRSVADPEVTLLLVPSLGVGIALSYFFLGDEVFQEAFPWEVVVLNRVIQPLVKNWQAWSEL